ncbi:MAG: hypothetical protein ACOX8S_01740 [Christensenellales bacterium]|jgi:hypothetical protein
MKRRIISLLVSMVLILSMVPMTALAADGDLVENVTVGVDAGKLTVTTTLGAGATLVSVAVDGVTGGGDLAWESTSVVAAGTYTLTIVATKGAATETYTATVNVSAPSTVSNWNHTLDSSMFNSATLAGQSRVEGGKLLLLIANYDSYQVSSVAVTPSLGDMNKNGFEWTSDDDALAGEYEVTITFSESAVPDNTGTYTGTFTVGPAPTLSGGERSVDYSALNLDALTLELVGDELELYSNGVVAANPSGTVFSVTYGGSTAGGLVWSTDVSGAEIGDSFTVAVTATSDGASNDPLTRTLTYKIDVYDYMLINEYSYAIKVVADSGVSGYTFSPNYVGTNGGYYFFSGNETTITIAPVLYYSVSSATIDNGDIAHKNTLHGIASYEIELPTATSNPESNSGVVATVTIKTGKTTIGDTAPTHYYTIKAYAGTGGTISPSGSVSVPNGGNQSFIIVPNSGYEIESVVVDGVNRGALSAFTFTDVDADHSIIASFRKVSGTVTPSPTQPGTTLPPIVTPPTTIPATGATSMVLPGVALLLAGIALLPKRRSK